MNLRPAILSDIVDNSKKLIKGRMYFVRGITGKFDKFPNFIDSDTDRIKLSKMFKNGQIYVCAGYFDEVEIEVKQIKK